MFCFKTVWSIGQFIVHIAFACRCVLAEMKSLGSSYRESLNAANNLIMARLAISSLLLACSSQKQDVLLQLSGHSFELCHLV